MEKNYDAVIIGAGIMGCSIALELSRKGWRTLNLDKLSAAGAGSTANSCAVIRVHYSTLEGTAVAYESYFYWDDWRGYLGVEDPRGRARFVRGGIMVFKSDINDGCTRIISHLEALGVPHEEWDMNRVREKYPLFDPGSYFPVRRPEDPRFGESNGRKLTGALYYPCGGFISDPILSTHNVQVAAQHHGARFRFGAAVVGIRQEGGRVTGVELDTGEGIDAPVVVNAAGPHSFIINRLAGVEETMRVKTRALRQEVVHLPAPAGIDYEGIGFPVSDGDIGCYSRPETGNHILCGSEDPPCDPQEWIEDPDRFNTNLTEQARAQACRLALRIPDLGIPTQLRGVVDLYDVTDDWIPIYDRSDLDGFYLCIGTSGNQYKNAPVVGKMMAELIERCQNGHDHDRDPLPFHLQNLNRAVSLKFFSRNREINTESSFSVLG